MFAADPEFHEPSFDPSLADPDPLAQFRAWLSDARSAGLPEPDAMALATATVDGHPSVRLVLLRGLDERGLAFFTNYESRKGVELAANARAALLFPWHAMRRQVRIEGPVERLTAAESDAYFASRPLDARFSAAASPQSAVIGTRAELERRVRELQSQHPAGDIPRPEFWGGYRVRPERWEFWQARRHRLHDRVSYQREDRAWARHRLAP